jgi:hypothetical protein
MADLRFQRARKVNAARTPNFIALAKCLELHDQPLHIQSVAFVEGCRDYCNDDPILIVTGEIARQFIP